MTYEIFAAYRPHAVPYEEGDAVSPAEGKEDPRIIRALNESPKLVFSRTLAGSDWDNTRVVRDRLQDEIRSLRREPATGVSIHGSASIVQALGRADLIDEYRLFVHPVMLGGGTPLFAAGGDRRDFELADVKPYANGAAARADRRAGRPRGGRHGARAGRDGDLDHALAIAKLTPIVDGGVEVRPLLGFAVAEAS